MNLALLASGEGWHVHDLARAAGRVGIEIQRVDFRSLTAAVGAPRTWRGPRAVLVRSMPGGTLEQVIFRMDVLQRLEAEGVRVVNAPRALEAAIDKYLCAARMEAAGLPVPATFVSERAADALEAFEKLDGDAVLKPIFGSEGRGLERVRSAAEARAAFEALESRGAVICLQRFVHHPGHDFRLFTLGGEVLCGMRRNATDGWITNVARGGKAVRLEVTPELAELALRAARSIGAEIAGVDILPDRDGRLWLLEVNAVPGWRALAQANGVDVAVELLLYLAKP